MSSHWKSHDRLTRAGFGVAWLGVIVTVVSQFLLNAKWWFTWAGIVITALGIMLRQQAEHIRKIKAAPRELSKVERKFLLELLSAVPKTPLRIHYVGQTDESKQYAIQFKELFTSAGFVIDQFSGAIAFEPCSGLGLTVCKWDITNPTAIGLKDALASAGIDIELRAIFTDKDPVVDFSVYPKPEAA